MRRLLLLAALAPLACDRGFSAPSDTTPRVAALLLADASSAEDRVVVAGLDPVRVTGVHLADAQLLFDGAPSPDARADGDGVLTGTAPLPAPGRLGTRVEVSVRRGQASAVAGHVRVYAQPALASAEAVPALSGPGPELVAPGLAVLRGTGFSPLSGETAVLLGGAPATVLVAEQERLLVSLEGGFPSGPLVARVEVRPTGEPRVLAHQVPAYLWQPLPNLWLDPDAARPGQEVLLRAGRLPTAALDRLDRFGLDPGGGVGPSAGEVGLPVHLDYVPDVGLDPAAAVAASLGSPFGDPKLTLRVDAVPSSEPLRHRDGLDFWFFRAPAALMPGPHQLQLSDPAGAGPATEVLGLPGHPDSPSLTCFPLDSWVGDGVLPETLRHHQGEGTLLGYHLGASVDCDGGPGPAVRLARYQAGGALDTPFCRFANDAGPGLSPLLAGRSLVYLADGQSPQLWPLPTSPQAGQPEPGPVGVLPLASVPADQALVAVAAAEPTLGRPFLWVVEAQVAAQPAGAVVARELTSLQLYAAPAEQAFREAAQGVLRIDRFSPPGFVGCASPHLRAATIVEGRVELAVQCDADPVDLLASGSSPPPGAHVLERGTVLLPDLLADGGLLTHDPFWERYPLDPADLGGDWAVQLAPGTALATALDGTGAVVVTSHQTDAAHSGTRLRGIDAAHPIAQAALSPDGLQVLALTADHRRVVVQRRAEPTDGSPPEWEAAGGFSLPAGSLGKYLVYDYSGAQAVLLLKDDPAAHPDGGGPSAVGGYCVVR